MLLKLNTFKDVKTCIWIFDKTYFPVEWFTSLPAAMLAVESLVWGIPLYWQKHSLELVDLPFTEPFFAEQGPKTSQLH